MTTYLTIDNGNTSAKAALWGDGRLLAPIMHGHITAADIDRLVAICGGQVDYAAWCSVADNNPDMFMAVDRLSQTMLTIDSSTPLPIDLHIYTTPHTLGADRIAAMAGAHSLHPGRELLVVDCGTAITYDVVTKDGIFAGGNIAPGIALRLEALYRFTSRLPRLEPTDDDVKLWGDSTVNAMQAGALYGVVGELNYYRKHLSARAVIVLTGGAVPYLLPHLSFPVTVDRDLVLTGLRYIIDYNRKLNNI